MRKTDNLQTGRQSNRPVCFSSVFIGIFAAGGLFFLVSDIMLILNTFGSETKQSLRVTNISLYYIGQLLIALSLRFLG